MPFHFMPISPSTSSDVLMREEALDMLTTDPDVQKAREQRMLKEGYPAYTTAAGRWGAGVTAGSFWAEAEIV